MTGSYRDIVLVRIKGRAIYCKLTEINTGVVYFTPISSAAGWRHATVREIVSHWRHTSHQGHPADSDQHSREHSLPRRASFHRHCTSSAAQQNRSAAEPPRRRQELSHLERS